MKIYGRAVETAQVIAANSYYLAAEIFKIKTDIDVKIVQFKGGVLR